MSDQPGRESFEDDLGSYSIDDEDQLQSEDTLLEPTDEPYNPPDLQPRNTEWGTTAAEQEQGESLEQRIRQEEPDPHSAYGAPDNEGGLDPVPTVGGDDPDAIPAVDDWLGGPAVGADEAGQLTEPDEGARPDVDQELVGEDTERPGGLSAEESAMRIVDGG